MSARRPGEACVHRRVLPEVPLEADHADPPVGGVKLLEDGERAVGRTVVDVDDLERASELGERRDRPPVELGQRAGLVVERDDDGDRGHAQGETSREIAIGSGMDAERN